jgi:cytokinin dehydrogenase
MAPPTPLRTGGPDATARLRRAADRARVAGVDVREPADFPGVLAAHAATLIDRYDFRASPCVDYGRLGEQIPRLWLRPGSRAALAECLRALAADKIPFKVRGGGHSSGGQALITDGVVVDMAGVARVLADDPTGETLTVEGGCHWLTAVEALHPQGRRPRVLTDNPRTTVAGTLTVGGFGDSSHRDGLQAAQVERLEIMTLDGASHDVGPGDPLFDHTLCGRAQLGVIATATLRTCRSPSTLLGRILHWNSLEGFLADARTACTEGYFDYFRARYQWAGAPPLFGVVGAMDGPGKTAMQRWDYPGFQPDSVSAPEPTDLIDHLRADHFHQLQHAAPALEVVYPFATAAASIAKLVAGARAAGLAAWLGHGSSIMVLRCDPRLPLAPLPGGDLAVLFALRLRMPESAVAAALPAIHTLGRQALDEGGKVYLMSVELAGLSPADFLDRQFGPARHQEFAALKQRWDPDRLLNPWIL